MLEVITWAQTTMTIVRLFLVSLSSDLLFQFVHHLLSNYGRYWLHLLTFIFVINPSFYLLTHYLITKIDPTFKDKTYADRCYTIKNISKSVVLCLMSIYCFPMFVQIIRTNQWPSSLIVYLGNVYVSTDVTALLIVPNLAPNTKWHHRTVLVLGIINTFVNYQIDGIHRAMVFLTFLSMIPYIVNTRLGVRFIEISDQKKKILSRLAATVYTGSIICNLIVQNYYIFFKDHIHPIARFLYFLVYYLIFYDDVILLNYLILQATGISVKDYFRNLRGGIIRITKHAIEQGQPILTLPLAEPEPPQAEPSEQLKFEQLKPKNQ